MNDQETTKKLWQNKGVDQDSMKALVALLPEFNALEQAEAKGERFESFGNLSSKLYRQLYDDGWIKVFDWSSWAHGSEGQKLFNTESGIEHASLDQLIKVTTAIVRADRFQQNHYDNNLHDGTFLRIARRVAKLLQQSEQPTY